MINTSSIACINCDRSIGARRLHCITDDGQVLCASCAGGGASVHAHLWPECTEQWHDPGDHIKQLASRSACGHLKGMNQ